MTSRIYYTAPDGRRTYKDMTCEVKDARGIFAHLFPGVGRIDRVEAVRPPKPRTRKQEDGTAELPLDAPPAVAAPIFSPPAVLPHEQIAGLKALRQCKEQIGGQSYQYRLQHPETSGRDGSLGGKWFTRGKEARMHGEPRDRIDGRMTPENRQAFQAGWDEQERFMCPPTEEQLAKSAEIASRLREWAQKNLR